MKYLITFALLVVTMMVWSGVAIGSYDAPATHSSLTLVERMANEPKTEVNRIKAAIEAKEAAK